MEKTGKLTLAAVLLALLLWGCGGKEKPALTVCVDGNGLNQQFAGPIFTEFQIRHPDITLEIQCLPPYKSDDTGMIEERTAALTRQRTQLMSGNGADVYLFFSNPGSGRDTDGYMLFPDLERHIMAGVIHDLDFLFQDPRFQAADYLPALTQAGRYGGKSYILPLSYTVTALVGVEENLGALTQTLQTRDRGALVQALLAMEAEKRPYLAEGASVLLIPSMDMPPVSVQEGVIQLEAPAWQQTFAWLREILARCPETADIFEVIDYETAAKNGAGVLIGASITQPPYALRVLGDQGFTPRLIPVPNEAGGVTARPYVTALVSGGSRNLTGAAELLLFLLSEEVQGCQPLSESGTNANLCFNGMSWPVRRGCGEKMLENLTVQPVKPGPIGQTLQADVAELEARIDSFRLPGSYDAEIYGLVDGYLKGEETWEACRRKIAEAWNYLDE